MTKSSWSTILSLVLLVSATSAVWSADAPLRPRLSVTATIFDAGDVAEGTLIEHSFTVRNIGKGTLEILNVDPG